MDDVSPGRPQLGANTYSNSWLPVDTYAAAEGLESEVPAAARAGTSFCLGAKLGFQVRAAAVSKDERDFRVQVPAERVERDESCSTLGDSQRDVAAEGDDVECLMRLPR